MNTNTKIEMIKDVALYVRKSRGEEEDLEKHREELIEMCNANNWRYVEFAEVGSSADIEYRPQLQKMLKDIEDEMFDAVLVIDKDRLSREGVGQAYINNILIEHDCLIVTPHKIYDLSNDSDMLMSEVEDLMARFEYRMTSKRFRRGKRRGAKRGEWTNGSPPFPYLYDPNRKGLVVDENNRKWYRFMVEKFLEGKPYYEISWELNRLGIKTSRGNMWHEEQIRRLLLQEVHLGKIIYNKTEGSGHKNKKTKPLKIKPREEWVIVENCHEPLKTQEEHDDILSTLSKRRRIPISSKQVKLPFASIIKCGICGKTMQTYMRKLVSKDQVLYLKTCQKADAFGNRCVNSGGNIESLIEYVLNEVESYLNEIKLLIQENQNVGKNVDYIKLKIEGIKKEIEKKEESIERIDIAFEEGLYDLDKYKKRLNSVNKEIEKLKSEMYAYESDLNKLLSLDLKKKQTELEEIVKQLRREVNYSEMNKIFKKLGMEIIWTKEGKGATPDIEINFTK